MYNFTHSQFVSATTVYKSMQSMVEHWNANTFRTRRKERSISEVFGMVYLFLRGRNPTIKERTLCLTLLPNGYSGIHLQANKIGNSRQSYDSLTFLIRTVKNKS